jgi:hypothetical protein
MIDDHQNKRNYALSTHFNGVPLKRATILRETQNNRGSFFTFAHALYVNSSMGDALR